MPSDIPPKGVEPQPRYLGLPAGSFLWRVTKPPPAPARSPFRELPEDPRLYDPRWGGRFDPTPECPYPYCYAAFDDLTALCEVLLRDVAFKSPLRYLPRRDVAGRQLAILETLKPLWLVSLLDAADLAAVCQDSWLVHSEDYRMTRRWGHWLRDTRGPDGDHPAGIVWPSKRQPGGRAVLLFGDRCRDAVIRSPFGERRLDDPAGVSWLNLRLSLLRTKLGPVTHRTFG
jgi:RES domain